MEDGQKDVFLTLNNFYGTNMENEQKDTGLKSVTYLLYVVFMVTLILGGTGYAVFVLDRSGWWFLLATFFLSAVSGPAEWIYGKKPCETSEHSSSTD